MNAPPVAVAPKRGVLGFFAGARALLSGLRFVVCRPSVWGWAAIPALTAAVLFSGGAALAVWGGDEIARRLLWDPGDGAATMAGIWLLRVLFWAVGLVVAFVVALSLAQPISGFALEAIARRQERALGGRDHPGLPFWAGVARSLRVSLAALAMGLPVLLLLSLVTFLFPPAAVVTIPLKLIVTGLLAAYDLLDYPLGLRGEGVRARLAFMRDHFWAVLGFGVTFAALLLVPGMALLLLPFGVAGATRLVVAAEPLARVRG